MSAKLFKGNCLELLKQIDDKSIDLILADPPYAKTHNHWDTLIPFDRLWEQYNRVIKDHGAIVLFGQADFSAQLIMSNPKMFRYTLVWDKVRTTGFLNARRMPLRRHEDIIVFYKKLPTYNPQMIEGREPSHSRGKKWASKGNAQDSGRIYGKYQHDYDAPSSHTNLKYPTSILRFSNKVQGNFHPTQKPIDLLQYLIKTYTDEGMTVLDNTMGSGSTGVAAVSLNRDFIGMELDEGYFKIAKERIERIERSEQI